MVAAPSHRRIDDGLASFTDLFLQVQSVGRPSRIGQADVHGDEPVSPIYMTGNCDLPYKPCRGFDVLSVGTLQGGQVSTAQWMAAD